MFVDVYLAEHITHFFHFHCQNFVGFDRNSQADIFVKIVKSKWINLHDDHQQL